MDLSSKIVAISILIVVIIVIIFLIPTDKNANWQHLEYWKSMYMESPSDVLNRSMGNFDKTAELAFHRVDETPKPTYRDNLLVAKILVNNVIINDDYKQVSKHLFDGGVRTNSIQEMFDYIYLNCVKAIISTPNNKTDIRNMVNQFPSIYAYMHIIGMPKISSNIVSIDQYFAGMLATKKKILKGNLIKYIKPIYTNDLQNSMDITVMGSVKGIITLLEHDRIKNVHSADKLDDIIDYYLDNEHHSNNIVTGNHRIIFLRMVIITLQQAQKNYNIKRVPYKMSIGEIIELLWCRCHHPKNDPEIMKQALYDALFNCWGRGIGKDILFCPNGQIAILVGMLAAVDFDERTWNIQYTEHIKNNIYQDIAQVLNHPNVNHRVIIDIIVNKKLANPNIPKPIADAIRFECSEAFI